MLSNSQIKKAIANAPRQLAGNPVSPDGIRVAYEWLDAQRTIATPLSKSRPLKHIIEKWGGCYVSQTDVELAAWLHPSLIGTYSKFNISSKLTRPSARRLEQLGKIDAQKSWPNWPETGEAYQYSSQE